MRVRLDMPHAGTLQVTLGFVDSTGDPGVNRCAMMAAPLRSTRKGVRAP